MTNKSTYEELEQKVKGLEEETIRRKQAEEALKEKTDRLLKAQRVARMGFLDWNLKTNEMYWSDQIYNLYGIDRQEQMSNIDLTMELVHPDDLEFVEKNLDLAIKGIKEYDVDHRKLRTDGTVVWVHAQAEVVRDADGNPESMLGTVVDITERKLAEEALLESENNFRTLAENVNDGILIAIDDGVHIFANKRASEITGYTTSELLSATIEDLAHPDEFDRIIERYRRIISGKPFQTQYETVIINKDGKVVPIEVSSAKTVWQGKPADIVSIRDITERQQMERALQEAHDELEQRVEERTRELELKTKSLEELNTAMKVLLNKRKEDKIEVEQNVMTNVRELIAPYFDKINETKLDDHQKAFLHILESNLNEIISPFTRRLSLKYLSLTPKEIQIVNMIKIGYPSKKIAKIMKISPRTVDTHRKNIRSKIGLGQKRANLRSHILAHEQ